jgi:hypothetical protein
VGSTSHLQNAILQTIRALASTLKFAQQWLLTPLVCDRRLSSNQICTYYLIRIKYTIYNYCLTMLKLVLSAQVGDNDIYFWTLVSFNNGQSIDVDHRTINANLTLTIDRRGIDQSMTTACK